MSFFRGWRRKVGVVTLMMALVSTGAWVRSLIVSDVFRVPAGKNMTIASAEQFVAWVSDDDPNAIVTTFSWVTFSPTKVTIWDEPIVEWSLKWHGFGIGHTISRPFNRHPLNFWTVPYWSIAIPLTLLSAFLLLSKARPSTQKKIPEPVSAEGA